MNAIDTVGPACLFRRLREKETWLSGSVLKDGKNTPLIASVAWSIGFFPSHLDVCKFEFDGLKLNEDKRFVDELMKYLDHHQFQSEISMPYVPFMLLPDYLPVDFEGNLEAAFRTAMSIPAKARLKVTDLTNERGRFALSYGGFDDFLFPDEEEDFRHVDMLLRSKLKNLYEVSFVHDFTLHDRFPIFWFGQLKSTGDFVGVYSVGQFK